jgi:hypothetical protein
MAFDWKKALIAALVVYAVYHFFFRKTSGYKLNDLDVSRSGNYGTGPAAAGYMSMADYSSEFPGGEKLGEFTPDKILAGQNFLDPRSQIGYPETIGGNLRNANRQERSEPPNPRAPVSIWNQSTIPPDVMRPAFEIGSGEY